MNAEVEATRKALRTPRAAAISGIAFSLLLTISLVLIRLAISQDARASGSWVANPGLRNSVLVALNLIPFSGIAFLWFIGVVRDRMGLHEDRFFASVFLGSGLLFVAMLFASTAMAVALITSAASASANLLTSDTWRIDRALTYTLLITYAMRMAAVFMIATATITLRIAIMPKWLGLLGYGCAFVLLLSAGYLPWIEVLFPAWVFIVSTYILVASFHTPQKTPAQSHNPVGDPAPS